MKKEIIVLGFSLGHDTGAAIVSSTKGILAAVNEERLNREKQTKVFPIKSIQECLRLAQLDMKDIDCIGYSNYETDDVFNITKNNRIQCVSDSVKHFINKNTNDNNFASLARQSVNTEKLACKVIRDYFILMFGNYLEHIPIGRIEHHLAHGLPAYIHSNFSDNETNIVITSDGFGDDRSMVVLELGNNNKYRLIDTYGLQSSLGLMYQFVTGGVGYTMNLHEGKITGLAARGSSKETSQFFFYLLANIDDVVQQFDTFENRHNPIKDFKYYEALKHFIFEYCKTYISTSSSRNPIADLAAGIQYVVECMMIERVVNAIDDIDCEKCNIILSGGLFANVELNRKLNNLRKVDKTFVFPNMGDGGLALGAAYSILADYEIKKYELEHIFFGYSINQKCVELLLNTELNYANLKASLLINRGQMISGLVRDGYIVANVVGKMEYGPRALCHRSIHFNCDDKHANTWLNQQLGRTETMPFAPVLLEEDAAKCFEDYNESNEYAGRFMTINYTATDYFKEKCPSAVHIDGTVRAQIVNYHEENKDIIAALKMYKQMTNKPAFINTSYNRHGEPIVMTEKEAIDRFLESNIHYLIIDNIMIEHPNIDQLPVFKTTKGE